MLYIKAYICFLIPLFIILPKLYNISYSIYIILLISAVAYYICYKLLPVFCEKLVSANIYGYDLNKLHSSKICKAAGLVPAFILLMSNILSELILIYTKEIYFIQFNAALHSLSFIILLGFVDDVIELRWSIKLILPLFAAFPLIVLYDGPTDIALPFIGSIDLSYTYYIYMIMLVIFCTNAINIYAGINGLEVGQSLIVACYTLTHSIIQYYYYNNNSALIGIHLLLPFITTSFALWQYNRFPSSMFVGDTYTYYAGMIFAIIGILGHCSKTLLLFFIPQVFNFIYSFPQLLNGRIFGIKCPRHRMAKLQPKTAKLSAVKEHYNLLNFYLLYSGDLDEETLCYKLLQLQTITCTIGLLIRQMFT